MLGPGTDTVYHGNSVSKLRQYAAFAALTYEILPRLEATAGLRYFNIKQTIGTRGERACSTAATPQAVPGRAKAEVNPKIELAYRAARDNLVYASAAKGFRPGGGSPFAVAPGSVPADLANLGLSRRCRSAYQVGSSLWTYEVGSKNQFLGRRLTAERCGLLYRLEEYPAECLPARLRLFVQRQCRRRRDQRCRAEQLSLPLGGLTLGAAASYTDAKISKSAPGVSAAVGQPVLDTPKWIAKRQHRPIAFALGGDVTATARADYQYRSSSLRMFENSFIVTTPAAAPCRAPNLTQRQHAYDVVNLGLTGRYRRRGRSICIVNNLLDESAAARP